MRSSYACHAFLSPCLASDHACCLPQERQTGTACEMSRSYSAHVGIAISAFSNPRAVIELCGFTSGMCVSLWRSRRRNEGTRGERSRRRGATAFCAIALALPCFPRGVRWGLRAPKPAPKSLRLSGLSSRCGGVALVQIRRVKCQRALPASIAVSLAFARSMPPLVGSATGMLPPSSMNAGSAAADL